MVQKHVPRKLWDYGMRWVCETNGLTYSTTRGLGLNGGIPLEKVTGETINISEYLDFGFYDWVWYYDSSSQRH